METSWFGPELSQAVNDGPLASGSLTPEFLMTKYFGDHSFRFYNNWRTLEKQFELQGFSPDVCNYETYLEANQERITNEQTTAAPNSDSTDANQDTSTSS